jgi:hypothetical protein
MSDGARFVAFQLADGALLMVDVRTGTQRRISLPADCPPAAMGFGRVVLACAPSLVDAATGRVRPIPGAHTGGASGPGDEFDAIGAQWLQGTGRAPGGSGGDVFVNWHTGARRVFAGHRNVHDLSGPGPPDLNDPRLRSARRCSGQWIYAQAGSRQIISGLSGQLVLERCGQPAPGGRVLDACSSVACGSVQLTAAYATWSAGPSAFAFSRRDGRTRVWRFAGFRPRYPGDGVRVAQAAGRVFFATSEAASAPPGISTCLYEAGP